MVGIDKVSDNNDNNNNDNNDNNINDNTHNNDDDNNKDTPGGSEFYKMLSGFTRSSVTPLC